MARVLITGTSSGFGLATALLLQSEGDEVYGTVRSLDGAGASVLREAGVVPLALDVNDEVGVERTVSRVLADGPIDALVNNAAIMLHATVEHSSEALARAVFETNFFGSLRMIRAVLPSMRTAGSGAIVSVSSTAGFAALPNHGLYAASKHAVEAISEALYFEVRPFGITVHVVEPGTFPDTGIESKALVAAHGAGSPYEPVLERFWGAVGTAQAAAPVRDNRLVADAIRRAIHQPGAPFHLPVGEDAEMIAAVRRSTSFEHYVDALEAAVGLGPTR